MRKINRKEIEDGIGSFLVEKNYRFYLLTKESEAWIQDHPEYMGKEERHVFPIGELPMRYMDSGCLRFIEDWSGECSYAGQFGDYVLFEGFDASTVTVGRHGDLDVRVCTDGSVVMLG